MLRVRLKSGLLPRKTGTDTRANHPRRGSWIRMPRLRAYLLVSQREEDPCFTAACSVLL